MCPDDEFEDLEAEKTGTSMRTLQPEGHYGPLPQGVSATLEVLKGPDAGARYAIERVPCIVGRGRHASFRLRDTQLSRLHAVIGYENDEFRIMDNGSENGTYLNGSQVTAYRLVKGDTLEMGNTTLRFV